MIKLPRDEGVVKYQSFHQDGIIESTPLLEELDVCRTKLFDMGLIGVYPDGVGYGNVSIRFGNGCIISGTATGKFRTLGITGYCYIQDYDLKNNKVFTFGPVEASSEAMTHCAIYQANQLVQCVIHVHNQKLFKALVSRAHVSTPAEVAYGTPEMAFFTEALVRGRLSANELFVMLGHEDGIVAFGQTVDKAFNQLNYAITINTD